MILTLFIIVLSAFTLTSQENPVEFTSSNLPIVIINTNGQQIINEPKISADMGIIYNGEGARNNISDPFNNFSGKIGIEIRGSSSQMFPKKQYGLETVDSRGEDLNVSLLEFPEESDWILFAPYNDKSLIRDALMYKITASLGRYVTLSKFCELMLYDDKNNGYHGLYVLFEKIKRDKNRVNISKMDSADTAGDALTGGYIIKIDKNDGGYNAGWISTFLPYPNAWQRIYYQYDYPKPEDITPQQENYIQDFIYHFEETMQSPDFNDSQTGYPSIIDVESFVDFILLNELSKNVDAYRLSAFFHKDRDSNGGKLIAGPLWDYNLAFGNSDYFNASLIEGFHLDYLTSSAHFHNIDEFHPPFWWKKLFDDTSFRLKLNKRWHELRKNEFSIEKIYSYIDSLNNLLQESQVRNFERWPVLGVPLWPNVFVGNTHAEEINYLKSWILNRIMWLDRYFPNPVDVEDEISSPAEFQLYQNYPNPFNPATNIRFRIPGSGLVKLVIYDLPGNKIETVINKELPAGEHEIKYDGKNLSSGTYFYSLSSEGFSQTKKFILVK